MVNLCQDSPWQGESFAMDSPWQRIRHGESFAVDCPHVRLLQTDSNPLYVALYSSVEATFYSSH
jgi:hypothetical protein